MEHGKGGDEASHADIAVEEARDGSVHGLGSVIMDGQDEEQKKISPSAQLMQKRKQVFEVQEALIRQKEIFNEKEEQFRTMEEALKTRDEEFQSKMLDHVVWVEENERLVAELEKSIASEKKTRSARESELKRFQHELNHLKDEKMRLSKLLSQHHEHEELLGQAVRGSSKLDSVPDLLQRYRVLRNLDREIMDRGQASPSSSTAITTIPAQAPAGRMDEVLAMRHTLLELKASLREQQSTQTASTQMSKLAGDVRGEQLAQKEEIVQIIDSMHDKMLGHNSVRKHPAVDAIGKLEEVGKFIYDHKNGEGCRNPKNAHPSSKLCGD